MQDDEQDKQQTETHGAPAAGEAAPNEAAPSETVPNEAAPNNTAQHQPESTSAQPATPAQPAPMQLPPGFSSDAPYPVRIHSRRRQQESAPAPEQSQVTLRQAPEVQPQVSFAPQPQPQEDQVFEINPFQAPPDKEQLYIEQQEKALTEPDTMEPKKVCRHEYVRIFQRKLKDLNRRMVATKAFLPVGFKMGDFSHLGENSFCFCATCRVRLYPKRSQAEKAEARIALAQGKAAKAAAAAALGQDLMEEVGAKAFAELLMRVDDDDENEPEEEDENVAKVDIHVEEMEQLGVGVEDIDMESLKANQEEDSCELLDQEEN